MNLEKVYEQFKKHPRVFVDEEQVLANSIFISVQGANNDIAHHPAEKAIEIMGAAFAIIDDPKIKERHMEDERYILVENGAEFLRKLARFHRAQLDIPIIGIFGADSRSMVVKELIAIIIKAKYNVYLSDFFNDSFHGLSLNLLAIEPQHEIAILDFKQKDLMIDMLSMAKIDIGILVDNNLKIEDNTLRKLLISNGVILFDNITNIENQVSPLSTYYSLTDQPVIRSSPLVRAYGKSIKSPWLMIDIKLNRFNFYQQFRIQSNLFGKHWLSPLLLSFTLGDYFGVSPEIIKDRIESYYSAGILCSEILYWNSSKVLLDCYDASVESLIFFLQDLQDVNEHKKVVILGLSEDIISDTSKSFTNIFELANKNADEVFWVGKTIKTNIYLQNQSKHICFDSWLDVKNFLTLNQMAFSDSTFYVKGSSELSLEKIFNRYPYKSKSQ